MKKLLFIFALVTFTSCGVAQQPATEDVDSTEIVEDTLTVDSVEICEAE